MGPRCDPPGEGVRVDLTPGMSSLPFLTFKGQYSKNPPASGTPFCHQGVKKGPDSTKTQPLHHPHLRGQSPGESHPCSSSLISHSLSTIVCLESTRTELLMPFPCLCQSHWVPQTPCTPLFSPPHPPTPTPEIFPLHPLEFSVLDQENLHILSGCSCASQLQQEPEFSEGHRPFRSPPTWGLSPGTCTFGLISHCGFETFLPPSSQTSLSCHQIRAPLPSL